MLGAYKATPTAVLEAEPDMPSIHITLNHAVLRMQALRGIHPVTKVGNARIPRNLCKRTEVEKQKELTPGEEKENGP